MLSERFARFFQATASSSHDKRVEVQAIAIRLDMILIAHRTGAQYFLGKFCKVCKGGIPGRDGVENT